MLVERIPLLHLVLMFRLVSMATNEPSATVCSDCVAAKWTEPTRAELIESTCAASGDLMSELEVTPLVLRPRTQLIVDNHSPFYSELGYTVTKMDHNSAHLLSVASVELHLLRKDTHLTAVSEIGGIPL